MPVLVDGQVWATKMPAHPADLGETSRPNSKSVTIALVNNMPDSALEDTKSQFFELLKNASGETLVHLKLYSLPNIPRSDRARQHINNSYSDISDLLNRRFDGAIVTGTEPLHPDLRDEPYWPDLTRVLDWAERNTSSTVLSCLAAHAGVFHSDGIPRHRLSDKQFGVFEYEIIDDNPLTKSVVGGMHMPHSRWNEVRGDELSSCGYSLSAKSQQGGIDSFTKKKRQSLFVHFQGHPEYVTGTLLKEYRRDVRRFLRRERETYPSMPYGYFNAATVRLLEDFQENLSSDLREEQMASFPEIDPTETLGNTWTAPAVKLYRNWLHYLLSRKAESRAAMAVTRITS